MANVGSGTTSSTPLQYPSNTLMARRSQNGWLFVLIKSSTANQYDLYRSTNSGTSWSLFVSRTRTGLQELGSIFFDKSGWLRWVYRITESSEDRIYITGMDVTRSSPSWESELRLGAAASGTYTGVDVWSTISGGREYFAVAVGKVVGAAGGVEMLGAYTPSIPGLTISDPTVIMGTRIWLPDGTGRQTPSLDGTHTGDGASGSSPHLGLWFGRTSVRFVKLSWNGDGWTGPSSPVTIATGLTAREHSPGLWDGTRYLTAARSTTNADRVDLYERNSSNSTTTKRTTPSSHPTGNITSVSLNYNTTTQDVRIYAVGTSTTVLHFITYIRASDTWSGWAGVGAGTALLSAHQWTRRRGTHGRGVLDVVTAHSGSPNVITHTAQSQSYATVTPTWEFDAVTWRSGDAVDVAVGLFLDWTFNASDPADVQTSYAVSRQIGAGALAYWRASDSTWQAAEVQNSGSITSFTVSSWGAGSDLPHTYKVKTWNAAAAASAYSDPLIVIPSVKVNPNITAPTGNPTITGESITVTWTATEQTAWRAQVAGGGDTISTGRQTGTDTSYTFTGLKDATSYTVSVWTWNNEGLESTVDTETFTTDFVEPATPIITLAPMPQRGVMRVGITNPTPGGGQPAATHNDVYRRLVTDTSGSGTRIAKDIDPNGFYDDWQVRSREHYEWQVVTYGDNGTNIRSAWKV